jgi:hypothetical protein
MKLISGATMGMGDMCMGEVFLINLMKKKLNENLGKKSLKNSIKRMEEEEYGSDLLCITLHCKIFVLTDLSCGSWDTHLE